MLNKIDVDVDNLRRRVKHVVNSEKLKRLFSTILFYFTEEYGLLETVVEGYTFLPPPSSEPFFLPRLTMTQYRTRNILFFDVAFREYDLNEYVTILNPAPIYDLNRNLVIRDVDSNTSRIEPKFIYQNASQAKLSKVQSNDIREYMFLLFKNGKYFEVIAIYPRHWIELEKEDNP